jgi:hypothetical protein
MLPSSEKSEKEKEAGGHSGARAPAAGHNVIGWVA